MPLRRCLSLSHPRKQRNVRPFPQLVLDLLAPLRFLLRASYCPRPPLPRAQGILMTTIPHSTSILERSACVHEHSLNVQLFWSPPPPGEPQSELRNPCSPFRDLSRSFRTPLPRLLLLPLWGWVHPWFHPFCTLHSQLCTRSAPWGRGMPLARSLCRHFASRSSLRTAFSRFFTLFNAFSRYF